jgi:hypothetical protein
MYVLLSVGDLPLAALVIQLSKLILNKTSQNAQYRQFRHMQSTRGICSFFYLFVVHTRKDAVYSVQAVQGDLLQDFWIFLFFYFISCFF